MWTGWMDRICDSPFRLGNDKIPLGQIDFIRWLYQYKIIHLICIIAPKMHQQQFHQYKMVTIKWIHLFDLPQPLSPKRTHFHTSYIAKNHTKWTLKSFQRFWIEWIENENCHSRGFWEKLTHIKMPISGTNPMHSFEIPIKWHNCLTLHTKNILWPRTMGKIIKVPFQFSTFPLFVTHRLSLSYLLQEQTMKQ